MQLLFQEEKLCTYWGFNLKQNVFMLHFDN